MLLKITFLHVCARLNTKRISFYGITIGSIVISVLVYMLLIDHYYKWLPWIVNRNNLNSQNDILHSMDTQIKDDHLEKPKNINHYKYIINESDKCKQKIPFLVLLVTTQTWQQEARQAIRQTWGKEDFLPGVQILRLFLLGKDTEPTNEAEMTLVRESQQYHDIIQKDFMDTYNNLTLKTLMGMDWVATYCPQVSYVMKTDSDMFVNTEYLIINILKPNLTPRLKYFTGYFMKNFSPNRNKESKWYMPPELYPYDQYPVFCSGTGYVFSGDMAEKIIAISANVRILHLEDVYVGICLEKLGISPVPPPKDSDFNHWKVTYSHCLYNQIVTSHQFEPDELLRYWNTLQDNKHICLK